MNRFEQELSQMNRVVGIRVEDGADFETGEGDFTVSFVPEPLRILSADDPAKKEERDFFGVVYCALATIGAMAIFYWGARAIQLLVRWAR